jgi:two-component system, chemotaxis family, sensor kinase Cph1
VHSQPAALGEQIDLTNCDREPIHTPGTVQPHGALLALDPTTERILAASANAPAFTGISHEQTVNALATDVFGASGADALRALMLATLEQSRALAVRLPDTELVALLHRAGDTVLVEIEPAAAGDAGLLGATRDAVRGFMDIENVQVLCDKGAAELRDVTAYDRVMVYRFDADGHGSVVAEARNPTLEAFLGRHYPASDIPRQARALYRTTMLRLIVDVDAVPAALEPMLDPRNAEPWDLSSAILRSTSPIHLEYLRNMGVTATMTISLLREGELWGLIACHHYTPKYVGSDVRAVTETIGHALVARIVQLEDARISSAQIATQNAVIDFITRSGRDGLGALAGDGPLHEALGIGGAVLIRGDATVYSGNTLPPARLAALTAWLAERTGSDLFVTDSLAKLNPAFIDIADVASGVYAWHESNTWFLAFRGERVQVVDWGGDPAKAAEERGGRLSPRGSFALWREEVRHRSEPWEPWILDGLNRATRWAQQMSSA